MKLVETESIYFRKKINTTLIEKTKPSIKTRGPSAKTKAMHDQKTTEQVASYNTVLENG